MFEKCAEDKVHSLMPEDVKSNIPWLYANNQCEVFFLGYSQFKKIKVTAWLGSCGVFASIGIKDL